MAPNASASGSAEDAVSLAGKTFVITGNPAHNEP